MLCSDNLAHTLALFCAAIGSLSYDDKRNCSLQNDVLLSCSLGGAYCSSCRYGSGKDAAAKLLPLPHDQAEKDKFWLSPPRYTTVIPVIAKADSMTIDEKWECQRALAVALRQKKTIKWVNLRQQFPPGNPAAMVRCALPLARGGAAVHMPCMLQPASLDHTCSTHEA